MTREEVIECMAFGAIMSAYPDGVWDKSSEGVKNLYRDKMEAGLAALEARGETQKAPTISGEGFPVSL